MPFFGFVEIAIATPASTNLIQQATVPPTNGSCYKEQVLNSKFHSCSEARLSNQ
jgi:hypothetical protein